MAQWWESDTDSQFIRIPEGSSETFIIREIKQSTENPDYHPKKNDEKKTSQGWHLEITDTKGRILSVGSFNLQRKLREAASKDRDNPKGPLIGRKITVLHPGRGEWAVMLGNPATPTPQTTPVSETPDDNEPPF